MLKKLIKYIDYNGNERSENFYFNLNKAELMEMELGVTGGMRQLLQLIIDKQDIPKIMDAFKTIILKAYGEKSPDGRIFNKSPELSDAFAHTEAYSELYMELISDGNKAAAFINGLLPKDIQNKESSDDAVLTPMNKEESKEEVANEGDDAVHLLK